MTLSNKASLGLKHVLNDYGIFVDSSLLEEQIDSSNFNDSCELIVDWITERYADASNPSPVIRFALKTYNRLSFLESLVHKRVRGIRKRIASKRSKYTAWPIDYTVYKLKELVKDYVANSCLERYGFVPMVNRWPYPYKAAMVITHDVDKELKDEFLKIIEIERKYNRRSTWNFIAKGPYKLNPEVLKKLISEGFEVGCHGLYHDRLFNSVSREERKMRVAESKKIIESVAGKEVLGFRTPILDRTSDLWDLLEDKEYLYDSSYPDVDHLTTSRYGMGVSTNMPYNVIIERDGTFEESMIIELPVSAPQDVDVLIDRELSEGEALEVYKKKGNEIISRGGVIIYIFHPHILRNEKRFRMYDSLLEYFSRREDLWITTAEEVAKWWNLRRGIRVSVGNSNFKISSENEVKDVVVKILGVEEEKSIRIDVLKGFETIRVAE